ncbi:hypothetical protein [Enterococcus sp. AZ163]|uniref:hypothetical protein n=1 Tax=Enterococcus sp. AZ163 TaxID=2774638 RepID=UPI003D286D85
MNLENEKAGILAGLEQLYLRNKQEEGYSQLMNYLDSISSVFIAKRPNSELLPKLRTVPIARLRNGNEVVLLSPSLPLWINKTEQEDEADAEIVVSGLTRLIEIEWAIND